MKLRDLLLLKFPGISFIRDVILSQDGEILMWNLQAPTPNRQDLETWASELDLAYRQQQARDARIYPPVITQLDMQYHDKIDNTDTWGEAIAAVKAAHPIPTE